VPDIREMLGRLNPTNIRYDTGKGGGAPDLTAQDIAAALAFVKPGLGREVFARLWWPDGARLSPRELGRTISNLVHAEAARRHNRLQKARIELHIAEEDALSRRVSTDFERRTLRSLQMRVSHLKLQVWPYQPEMHVAIREAILDEIARPNLCDQCGGRGTTMRDNLVVICGGCKGARILPVSDRTRAAKIGRDESSYRASWKGLYEWLFRQVADEEHKAACQFAAALRRDDMQGAA